MTEFAPMTFPYIQTICSALGAFLLGIFWYNPKMLGARWLAARGANPADMQRHPRRIIYSLVLWLFSAAFYSFMVLLLPVETLPAYVSLSCLIWVAFVMPPIIMGVLYTGSSFEAATIDAAYQLTCYYLFALVHIVIGGFVF